MASFDSYFSVLALFILFRETIEASIICGVLMQFLNRSKPALKKAVWYGVAGGVGVSIIFGVIFIAVFYTAKNSLFSGKNRDWFKGVISWIAALLITILGFAMLRFLGWEAKWKRKLAAAMAAKVPEVAPVVDADADAKPAADADGTAADAAIAGGEAPARRSSSDSSDAANPPRQAEGPMPMPLSSPSPDQPQSRASATQHQRSELTSPTLTTTSSGSESATGGVKKASAVAAAADPVKPAAAAAADVDVEAAAPKAVALSKSSTSSAVVALSADAAVAAGGAAEELDPCDRTPATRRENFNIFILVFTTVVREGIESVVFLGGLGNVKLSAVPLPAFVGIVCGVLVGMFLYYSGKQVKHIKWLVIGMAIVIFFIAAGQVSIGTDALMRAGAFGYCSPWLDERPWYMQPMADFSACCSDTDPTGREPTDVQNRKRFFALARAIFGYQDKPTPTEIIAYCCYWGLVLIVMAWKAWRGTLLDADYKHTREVKRAEKEAAARARAEAEAAAREAEALEGGEGVVGVEGVEVAAAATGPVVRAERWWVCGGSRGWRGCFAPKAQ